MDVKILKQCHEVFDGVYKKLRKKKEERRKKKEKRKNKRGEKKKQYRWRAITWPH